MKQITLKQLLVSIKGKSIYIDKAGRVYIGTPYTERHYLKGAITSLLSGVILYALTVYITFKF